MLVAPQSFFLQFKCLCEAFIRQHAAPGLLRVVFLDHLAKFHFRKGDNAK